MPGGPAVSVRQNQDSTAGQRKDDDANHDASPALSTTRLANEHLDIRVAGKTLDLGIQHTNDGASITSIMLDVQLVADDRIPIYEQVATEIRRAIATGECHPGERLPPARDLAAVLHVNANTVLRALRLLRDDGILEFRRGRGIRVTEQAPQRSAIEDHVRDLLTAARQLGYSKAEVIELIGRLP
jgi:DNA-binding transcriptional regulator YhcF (GntR family)